MNIRLYNARILTMEEKRKVFRGEVQVCDGRIAGVIEGCAEDGTKGCAEDGPKDGPRMHFDLEMDCEGNLLMPGFKDAHTHSPMTFLRSFADDLPLQEWLQKKIFIRLFWPLYMVL